MSDFTPEENATVLATVLGIDKEKFQNAVIICEYLDNSNELSLMIEQLGKAGAEETDRTCSRTYSIKMLSFAIDRMAEAIHTDRHQGNANPEPS